MNTISPRLRLHLVGTIAMLAMLFPRHRAGAEPNEYLIGFYGVGASGSQVAHVIGFIRPDGTGEQFPTFDKPNQHSWVFGPQFSDGRRIFLGSSEELDVAKVRAGKAITRDWIYDLHTGALEAACEKDRQADQLRPYALIANDTRVIETAYIGTEERIFIKDLDGANVSSSPMKTAAFITRWNSVTTSRASPATSPAARRIFITPACTRSTYSTWNPASGPSSRASRNT